MFNNHKRLASNREETKANVTAYIEEINSNKAEPTASDSQTIPNLLNRAAKALAEKKYDVAIDLLEEAKDYAAGITWRRLDDSPHKDKSVDLIRDATRQAEIKSNPIMEKHLPAIIRSIGTLRAGAALHRAKKAKKESHITECHTYLHDTIQQLAGQDFTEFSFDDLEYNGRVRRALKKDAKIKKHKGDKLDFTRKAMQLEDKQYHVTTVYQQKHASGADVYATETTSLMLGYTESQTSAYTNISNNKNGYNMEFAYPLTQSKDQEISEPEKEERRIISAYNRLPKYQKKIVSAQAVHIKDGNKVVPSYASMFSCLQNPQTNTTTVYWQGSEITKNPGASEHGPAPKLQSKTIQESFSVDEIAHAHKGIRTQLKQLQTFFPEEDKLNLTVLGSPRGVFGIRNPFSYNAKAYFEAKNAIRQDNNLSNIKVTSLSLKAKKTFIIDDLGDLEEKLRALKTDLEKSARTNPKLQERYLTLNGHTYHLHSISKYIAGAPMHGLGEALAVIRAYRNDIKELEEKFERNKQSHQALSVEIKENEQNLKDKKAEAAIDQDLDKKLQDTRSFIKNLETLVMMRSGRLTKLNKLDQSGVSITSMMHEVEAAITSLSGIASNNPESHQKEHVIMTSKQRGRVALVQWQAVNRALNEELEVRDKALEAENTLKQQSSMHTKHMTAAMGLHGYYGVDRKDLKGIINSAKSAYQALVDDSMDKITKFKHKSTQKQTSLVDSLPWPVRCIYKAIRYVVRTIAKTISVIYEGIKSLLFHNYNANSETFICETIIDKLKVNQKVNQKDRLPSPAIELSKGVGAIQASLWLNSSDTKSNSRAKEKRVNDNNPFCDAEAVHEKISSTIETVVETQKNTVSNTKAIIKEKATASLNPFESETPAAKPSAPPATAAAKKNTVRSIIAKKSYPEELDPFSKKFYPTDLNPFSEIAKPKKGTENKVTERTR